MWEQLRPTIAYESATKYDFPRNEFLTGSYSSPITSQLLFDARVSDIIQGWKDRYPDGRQPAWRLPSRSLMCSSP